MIKYYEFLSNGITSALIKEGSVEWLPLPRFDSPSIFTRMLDEERGGYFSIKPIDNYEIEFEDYFGNTLILRTVFKTNKGKAEVIDFLPLSLSGIIRIYDSEIDMKLEVKPFFEYGLISPSIIKAKRGIIFKNPKSKEGIEILIGGEHEKLDNTEFVLKKGKGYVYLLYSKDLRYGLFSNKGFVYSEPYEALKKAIRYWERRVERAKKVSVYKEAYYRSLLVLLGLIYEPSGGIIASPTTSLPEIVGGSRNWDYRYVWVRDASYSAEALIKASLLVKARDIISFLTSMIDPSSKSFDHPLYTVDGTAPPAEEILDWLEGHEGSFPVRVGNAAYMQIQMDVEGTYMNALYEYFKENHDIQYIYENWWAIEAIAEWTKKSWKMKSTDLWEQRGVEEHFTHTKVMNWVAMDRASKLAKELNYNNEAEEWRSIAEEIRKDILENGYNQKLGYFTRHYGSDDVDSALLTLPLYGFIDPNDRRFLNTLSAIEKELTVSEGLLLRYKNDFLGNVKNPFTLVSTWLARVYIRLNQLEKAKRVIEKLINCSTTSYLLAEHLEANTCKPRGNFPQAFPHAGLVMAILELEERM
ncbi:glycoside hydrolase family 15 protein [Sulfolobus sp. A20-N-F6]|uniref:alpha,alpha-trehalase TreH2 n=1 Tax=Saccharolobus sp. A20 TaxID=1891280 RepID=UPI000845EE6F|nr:alpha,alpha-trehalase TreH2 [Sulfolobus sp. A20]TRM76318.1 glycoside hydrolase family 15 protein [Sulfolobus sp. A20-N-F8]TRM84288.1 glycoside hydrolase family 15 protein [Sulfolobus sp. A20-N-F6]TRM89629.1 glycoside hydrolase family 15 protein [Sulfolobus sp. C3]TRM94712.1 glycoside hydrolase family 15 protein [Sulfolobus sp. A20-N-G8]TRM99726.1 glycoside hydrolase family 15 protein [Sulfolobus sp. F1]TRN04715.1 glycoside hydrolase family 15 protein [Sulfolobus sp. E1]